MGPALRKRHAAVGADVKVIAWKAQHRLHARYRHLLGRGKSKQTVVTAVARELLGFIWAIGVTVPPRRGRRLLWRRSSSDGVSVDQTKDTPQRWWSRGPREGESSRALCDRPSD